MELTSEALSSSSSPSSSVSSEKISDGVEMTARIGYAAKGVVYAVIGGLAVKEAFGSGGDVTGSREALREIASGPFGTVLLGLVTAGLAAYAIWRLVQAVVDPEGSASDSDGKRWAQRAFYLFSAVVYGFLTWYGISILMGSGGGSSSSGQQTQGLLAHGWGAWLVGIAGVAVIARGGWQLWKAYTDRFRKKIRRFDLGPVQGRWVLRASRVGLTARGVVFGIIGVSLIYAALTRDPSNAQGTEGALGLLVGTPWLLGAVGAGLFCYAVYQWVKARYRIIGL
jgi:hypothetical protein